MRKGIGLLGALLLTGASVSQVTACGDNSKYNEFISYVNNGETFFGALGVVNDGTNGCPFCQALQFTFDQMNVPNPTNPDGASDLQTFYDKYKDDFQNKGISSINLHAFEANYLTDDKGNLTDKPADFWNSKKMSWQRNIFTWVHDHINSDAAKGYKKLGTIDGSNPPKPQAIPPQADNFYGSFYPDGTKVDMGIPVFFVVSKGVLKTAGFGWGKIDINPTPGSSIGYADSRDALEGILIDNLLLN